MIGGYAISLVIPARDEAAAIGKVLREIPREIDQIIVVDNGSTDDTATVAKAHGATVLREDEVGYGAACQAGIARAGGDLIAFMDADYSDHPRDLLRVIKPLVDGDAELVIGARVMDGDSVQPLHQRFGNRLICGVINLLFGARFRDVGPMRCIRRESLATLNMTDRDFGWTVEMQIKAIGFGLRVREVNVGCRRRIGKSKISGTYRGTIGAAVKMFYWIIRLRFGGGNRRR